MYGSNLKNFVFFWFFQLSVPDSIKDAFVRIMNGNSHQKFPSSLRNFALTLHFYSPRAYDFVRENFASALPHPSTIKRWYSAVGGGPGFTKEVQDSLKIKVSRSKGPVICGLVMDEMSIKKNVEWTGNKLSGLVDFGCNLNDDNLPEAKNVLVFLVNCLNEKWKMPVGYFCITTLNKFELANLVNLCLEHLHSTGVSIVSLTFDGAPSKIAMAEHLECNLQSYNDLRTWFLHPVTAQPVYIFLDPSHMIKLVRNALSSMSFLDNDNGIISWCYLEKLVAHQEKEGLHAGNKIRRSHIYYKDQIMKVKLATQTLSNSVSTALLYLKSEFVHEFQNCAPTANFIKIMNDTFDFLNSRSLFAKGLKCAFKPSNEVQRKQFASYAESYIASLKQTNGDSIFTSQRKTGFLGLVICLKSLTQLFDTLINVDPPKLKYLLSYKISQDHLETFFSAIRARGGFNNNPTARQFETAYKRLLVHATIKGSPSANCLDSEETKILSVQQKRFIDEINNMKDSTETEDDIETGIILTSNYVKDVSKYIAGSIVRKLNSTVKCEICFSALIDKSFPTGLIAAKSYSINALVTPSPDVVYICNLAENIFRQTEKSFGLKSKSIFMAMMIKILGNLKSSVFDSIKDHQFDNDPEDNHIIKLIKTIITKYLNIRMRHALNTLNNDKKKVRSKLTKLILFQNQ